MFTEIMNIGSIIFTAFVSLGIPITSVVAVAGGMISFLHTRNKKEQVASGKDMLKITIGIIVVGLIVIGVIVGKKAWEDYKELLRHTAVVETVNKINTESAKTDTIVSDATIVAINETSNRTKDLSTKHVSLTKKRIQLETSIKASKLSPLEKANKISEVRITNLWEVYNLGIGESS